MITDFILIIEISLDDRKMIIIRMIIGETRTIIQAERKIDKMIIDVIIAIIRIKIIHYLEKMATDNNIEGVVIRKTTKLIIIAHLTRNLISRRHINDFSMILREKTPTSRKPDNHNMNMVNLVAH